MMAFLDRTSAAIARFALSSRGVLLTWGSLLVALFLMRSFLFPGTDADDAEQLISAQGWALGYGVRNPPLFTWIVALSQQVFGVSIAAVVSVKFSLLAISIALLHHAARIVLEDDRLAALAALSPLAIYYVSWDSTFHYTHSVLLAASLCFTFVALLRLERRSDLSYYIMFGLAIGIGLLSKYNYALFLAALIPAALGDKKLRGHLANVRTLISATVAAALALPHYLWLWTEREWLSLLARDRFMPKTDSGIEIGGLIETGNAVLSFLLPLIIVLIVLFPRALLRAGTKPALSERYRRLLGVTFLIMLTVTAVGVLALGVSRVRIHYMFLLFLFPIYFFARAQAAGTTDRAINFCATALLAFAIIVPSAVVVKYFVDPLRKSKGYYHMPYADFARQLKAAGFKKGTVIGDWLGYPLAGNLRPYFPDSRFISLLDWQYIALVDHPPTPVLPPRDTEDPGQCLILWTPQKDGQRNDMVLKSAHRLVETKLDKRTKGTILSAPMHRGHGRMARLSYILLVDGDGHCQ